MVLHRYRIMQSCIIISCYVHVSLSSPDHQKKLKGKKTGYELLMLIYQ